MNKQTVIELKAKAYDLVNKGQAMVKKAEQLKESCTPILMKGALGMSPTDEEKQQIMDAKVELSKIAEEAEALHDELEELDKHIAEEEAKP